MNTFGNTAFNTNHPNYGANQAQSNDPMRATQYANSTSGPPFHISNINSVNLHARSNPSYSMPEVNSFQLYSTTDVTNDSEMDLSGSIGPDHPSPATISSQSRGGSTSQSSYSPSAQNNNNTNNSNSTGAATDQTHHLPYRASPKTGFASATAGSTAFPSFNGTPSPAGAGAPTTNPSTLDMYSTAFSGTGIPTDEAFNHGFLVGSEWDYAGMSGMAGGTGMTPMSDGSWNQMLESVTMGWDGLGPPHEGELK